MLFGLLDIFTFVELLQPVAIELALKTYYTVYMFELCFQSFLKSWLKCLWIEVAAVFLCNQLFKKNS